jgi:WD40 repeat protein
MVVCQQISKMDTGDLGVFLTLFLLLGGAALYLFGFQKDDRKKAKQNKTAEKETETVAIKKPTKQKVKKIDRTAELKKKKIAETPGFSFQNEHPSLLHLLHGHKYGVTAAAYSPNGKFLSTASTDRTLHIYLRETLNEPKPKFHQISIEYDHVTALNFSSDGKILVYIHSIERMEGIIILELILCVYLSRWWQCMEEMSNSIVC